MAVATKSPQEQRQAAYESKILAVILNQLREARRIKMTGKLVFEVQLMKGGVTNADKLPVHTEIDVKFRILEEVG